MNAARKLNLSPELLSEAIECATRQDDVEGIIVFGSYARGDETPQSDVDLYVTLKDSADRSQSVARIGASLSACFAKWGLLNDTIIRSESLYRKNAKDRFTLEYRVAREGVPIYG